ncbi:32698_t:CDS:2, partial [Racocetra persica]
MNPSLPEEWKSYVDLNGIVYYYNTRTGISRQNPPYQMQSFPQISNQNTDTNTNILHQNSPYQMPIPQHYNSN